MRVRPFAAPRVTAAAQDEKPLKTMKSTPETMSALAREIARAEAKLQDLEREIEEIGQPAAHELRRRLDALKIEANALKRNLSEALGMGEPDAVRMEKVEALLRYIQSEEASVEHDAEFLLQSGHTTAEFAAQAGSLLVDLCVRAMKRVFGDHHPLGMSVFVNRSPESLAARHGRSDSAGNPERQDREI
jgi:chromosome segregation ATPase